MTEFELGYCVGLLEGEGAFHGSIQQNGKYTQRHFVVQCKMTDLEPLTYLQDKLGGYINGPYESFKDGLQIKSFWCWKIADREEVLRICKLVYPHMSPRRKAQIELIVKIMLENPRRHKKVADHGTYSKYSNGCSCSICVNAGVKYRKQLTGVLC